MFLSEYLQNFQNNFGRLLLKFNVYLIKDLVFQKSEVVTNSTFLSFFLLHFSWKPWKILVCLQMQRVIFPML